MEFDLRSDNDQPSLHDYLLPVKGAGQSSNQQRPLAAAPVHNRQMLTTQTKEDYSRM